MFDRILRQLRDRVRTRAYVVTLHADEEMNDDELTIFDVERCILTGEIVERQRDAMSTEWKYVVRGRTFAEEEMCVVAKLGVLGKLVIITVYRD